MAESFVRDTLVAWSTIPESTFNTALTTLGTSPPNYTGMAIEPPITQLPLPEQFPLSGQGTEFPVDFCNGYFAPNRFTFNPLFDFAMAMRFGLQAFGGTITDAQQAATAAYKHSCPLQTAANGVNMKGRSLAIKNGTLDFLFAGNAVDRFAIAQAGGAEPTVEVGIVGTSKYTNPTPFTIPAATIACPPIVTTAILITDSYGSARDLYAAECYNWRFELNNGADATSNKVRKGSDGSQGPTNGTAKYPSKIIRTFPRGMAATIIVNYEDLTGSSKAYWEQQLKRNSITSVSLRVRGDLIASTFYYQADWIIADGRWQVTAVQDQDQILAYALTLNPVNNATPATFAVTNIDVSGYA